MRTTSAVPAAGRPGRLTDARWCTAWRSGGGARAPASGECGATGADQRDTAEDVGKGAGLLRGAAVAGGHGARRAGGDLGRRGRRRGRRRGGCVVVVLAGDAVVVGVQALGVSRHGFEGRLGLGLAGEVGAVPVHGGVSRAGEAEGQGGGDQGTGSGGGAATHWRISRRWRVDVCPASPSHLTGSVFTRAQTSTPFAFRNCHLLRTARRCDGPLSAPESGPSG